jgi:ABC-type sugar transport system ATPase subunit
MLIIKNISFSRERPILKSINFTIKRGEVYGIVGPSGSGKSTLLQVIAGLLDAASGEVKLDGEFIRGPKDRLIPGHPEIQLVNQEFALDLYHTTKENLLVKAHHLPQNVRLEFAEEILQLLDLTFVENQKAYQLSGGEKQRLAIGRALIMEPKVLLLDEPFAHLDAHLKRKLSHYIQSIKKKQKNSILFVSHDGADVLQFTDRILFFQDGQIQRSDSPESFYYKPSSYVEGLYFGELNKINFSKKELLFRPNQFSLELSEPGIELEVSYQNSIFLGLYTFHVFKTVKNQIIQLLHNDDLKDVKRIKITEK